MSMQNYPLGKLPAPFLITRSFYPRTCSFYPRPAPFTRGPLPAPNRYSLSNIQTGWIHYSSALFIKRILGRHICFYLQKYFEANIHVYFGCFQKTLWITSGRCKTRAGKRRKRPWSMCDAAPPPPLYQKSHLSNVVFRMYHKLIS
jgi:hypothetical protein